MQAAKLRRVGFNGLIIVLAIGVLAGAIALAAFGDGDLPWSDRDRPAIERPASVSRPTDRPPSFQGLPSVPDKPVHQPTDRPWRVPR